MGTMGRSYRNTRFAECYKCTLGSPYRAVRHRTRLAALFAFPIGPYVSYVYHWASADENRLCNHAPALYIDVGPVLCLFSCVCAPVYVRILQCCCTVRSVLR